jgi:hypothetical protein
VGFESTLKKMIFFSPKQQRLTFGPTHTHMQCVQQAHSIVRLTTHPHLVPRLRMNVALPLPLLYAFMACRGAILPFLLLYITRGNKNNSKSFCSMVVFRCHGYIQSCFLMIYTVVIAVQLIH